MNRYWLLLAVLLSPLMSLSRPVHAEGPRLGILSDAGSRKEADLLMVELQKAKCELVERDQIAKVLGEQALQIGLGRAESQRIGQMLKADGLILISSSTNEMLAVRVVAAAPGVVVWMTELKRANVFPALANAVKRYLPKLVVKKNEAVPVSVLRFRSSISTTTAGQMALQATRVLVARLVEERALFVLEREDLRQLDEEQRWAGQGGSFWTGSALLDGTIDNDVTDPNQIVLKLRLRPPAGAASREVAVTEAGRADQLPQLADQLVRKLLPALGAQASTVTWDPGKEAQQYLNLVGSLVRHDEQKRAVEIAMALGARDPKTVRLYLNVLRSWFEDQFAYKQGRGIPISNEELRQTAERAIETLEFIENYRPPETDDVQWNYDAIVSTLSPWSRIELFLLYCLQTDRQGDIPEQIQRVRQLGRKLGERVWFDPRYRQMVRRNYRMAYTSRFYYGTVAEILKVYRAMYAPPGYATDGNAGGMNPPEFLDRKHIDPLFPAGNVESVSERDRLWEEFMRLPNAFDPKTAETPEMRLKLLAQYHPEALREIQDLIAQCPGTRHQRVWFNESKTVLQLAFPGKTTGTQSARFAEDAARARSLFLSCLPELAAKKEDVGPDASVLLTRYLEAYTLAQATELFAVLSKATVKNKASFLKQIVAQFPSLATAEYPTEKPAAAVPMPPKPDNQARQMQRPPLVIRQAFSLNAGSERELGWQGHPNMGNGAPFLFHQDSSWFYSRGVFGVLDFAAKEPARIIGTGSLDKRWWADDCDKFWRMGVCGKQLVFIFNHFILDDIHRQNRTWESWWDVVPSRGGNPQDVRQAHLQFVAISPAGLNGKIYAVSLTPKPDRASYPFIGIVELDPATMKVRTVFDSRTGIDEGSTNHPLYALNALHPIPHTTTWPYLDVELTTLNNELLVKCPGQPKTVIFENVSGPPSFAAWAPATGKWRVIGATDWQAAHADEDAAWAVQRSYGFELTNWGEATTNRVPFLEVQRIGQDGTEMIPLAFDSGVDRTKWPNPTRWSGPVRQSLAVRKTGFALPLQNPKIGFYEIPYADIQKWLAANPPKAGESAPAANKPASAK